MHARPLLAGQKAFFSSCYTRTYQKQVLQDLH